MASKHYKNFVNRCGAATELDWVNADIRAILVMTNTTAGADGATGTEAATVGNIGTLDEFDGSGYSDGVGGVAMASEAWSAVTGVQYKATFAAHTFAGLSGGTRSIAGILLIDYDTNQASSIPLGFVDITDFAPNGGDLVYTPHGTNGVFLVG